MDQLQSSTSNWEPLNYVVNKLVLRSLRQNKPESEESLACNGFTTEAAFINIFLSPRFGKRGFEPVAVKQENAAQVTTL